MSKVVLSDTGFWIGLFESRDENHKKSLLIYDIIKDYKIIIPWPSLYEFLNTRLSRNILNIIKLEKFLKDHDIYYLDDTNYKSNILELYISQNKINQKISLVDLVLIRMIEDKNINIDYLITFNKKDFFKYCQKRKIELISD